MKIWIWTEEPQKAWYGWRIPIWMGFSKDDVEIHGWRRAFTRKGIEKRARSGVDVRERRVICLFDEMKRNKHPLSSKEDIVPTIIKESPF